MTGWDDAVKEMRQCRQCPLAATRQHVVVYRGAPRPRVLFVGEAPGKKEDETGLPFVGRAGSILDRAIAGLPLPEDGWGITNEFMCRPPGNVYDPRAARACRPWFELKLSFLRPALLVSLGAHALHALLPESPPILEAAGRVHHSPWGPVFPLLHPAATVRRRMYAERWRQDLVRLRDILPEILSAPSAGGALK